MKQGNVIKYPFINNGTLVPEFKKVLPKAYSLLEELMKKNDGIMVGIPFSSSYISIMRPKSSIDKHFGPCNIRLRVHLPLIVPGA